MFIGFRNDKHQPYSRSYTYPQFIIDEKTGRIEVNFIDKESGRIVRHIPTAELNEILKGYGTVRRVALDR
jgi:uncharacterized FlaG/YvyC family protein